MNDDVLTPGLRRRLEQIEERYDELGRLMSAAGVAGNSDDLRSFGKELASLQSVVDTVRAQRSPDMEPRAGRTEWRRRLMSLGHDPLRPTGG